MDFYHDVWKLADGRWVVQVRAFAKHFQRGVKIIVKEYGDTEKDARIAASVALGEWLRDLTKSVIEMRDKVQFGG